jgi:hypothetical protein
MVASSTIRPRGNKQSLSAVRPGALSSSASTGRNAAGPVRLAADGEPAAVRYRPFCLRRGFQLRDLRCRRAARRRFHWHWSRIFVLLHDGQSRRGVNGARSRRSVLCRLTYGSNGISPRSATLMSDRDQIRDEEALAWRWTKAAILITGALSTVTGRCQSPQIALLTSRAPEMTCEGVPRALRHSRR